MKHPSLRLTALCSCAFLGPAALPSQSVLSRQRPYVAISKTTIYVEQPGNVEVIKDVIRNIEARDSQGRRFSSAGSNVPPQSRYDWIRDVVAGRSYFVNRHRKLAYFTSLGPTVSIPHPLDFESQAVEIRGVRCFEGPVRQTGPNGASPVIGTTCVSAELGHLLVHKDLRVELGGERLHIVSELEDLKLDTEPPPEWFEIPGDFQLLPGEPGTPAPQNPVTPSAAQFGSATGR